MLDPAGAPADAGSRCATGRLGLDRAQLGQGRKVRRVWWCLVKVVGLALYQAKQVLCCCRGGEGGGARHSHPIRTCPTKMGSSQILHCWR
jgi:hypothetical protein